MAKLAEEPKTLSKKTNYSDDPPKNRDSVFRFVAEARKTVAKTKKSQENKKSLKEFKCELCYYSCEKLTTLKKHTEQQCKVCRK